jgi:hypothetical protein
VTSTRKLSSLAAMRLARPIVRERSGGACEVCIPGVCLGRATNMHHRKPESHGGESVPVNLLHVCGSGTTGCHGYIEHHRAESYENGWLVRSWAVVLPIIAPAESLTSQGDAPEPVSGPPTAAGRGTFGWTADMARDGVIV